MKCHTGSRNWLRIGTSVGLLWTRKWTFGFHKKRAISWLAEWLLASQEGRCFMGWVIYLHSKLVTYISTYMAIYPKLLKKLTKEPTNISYEIYELILRHYCGFLSSRQGASSSCGRRKRPSDMESSCGYNDWAIADSWQEVVLHVGGWTRSQQHLTVKYKFSFPPRNVTQPRNWLRIGTSGGCCEDVNECLGSIKGGTFLDHLSDY